MVRKWRETADGRPRARDSDDASSASSASSSPARDDHGLGLQQSSDDDQVDVGLEVMEEEEMAQQVMALPDFQDAQMGGVTRLFSQLLFMTKDLEAHQAELGEDSVSPTLWCWYCCCCCCRC